LEWKESALNECGTTGHVHDERCRHALGLTQEILPRAVPKGEAAILERCRVALMHRSGEHTHSSEVPPMTTREATPPSGSCRVELGTVVVGMGDGSPSKRARLTSAVATAIGLPTVRIEKDAREGHWSYALGVAATLNMHHVVEAWTKISAVEGVDYVRIDGLSRQGLWVVETRPEESMTDETEAWRFVVSGPAETE
jgi:hypothetical protein